MKNEMSRETLRPPVYDSPPPVDYAALIQNEQTRIQTIEEELGELRGLTCDDYCFWFCGLAPAPHRRSDAAQRSRLEEERTLRMKRLRTLFQQQSKSMGV